MTSSASRITSFMKTAVVCCSLLGDGMVSGFLVFPSPIGTKPVASLWNDSTNVAMTMQHPHSNGFSTRPGLRKPNITPEASLRVDSFSLSEISRTPVGATNLDRGNIQSNTIIQDKDDLCSYATRLNASTRVQEKSLGLPRKRLKDIWKHATEQETAPVPVALVEENVVTTTIKAFTVSVSNDIGEKIKSLQELVLGEQRQMTVQKSPSDKNAEEVEKLREDFEKLKQHALQYREILDNNLYHKNTTKS